VGQRLSSVVEGFSHISRNSRKLGEEICHLTTFPPATSRTRDLLVVCVGEGREGKGPQPHHTLSATQPKYTKVFGARRR